MYTVCICRINDVGAMLDPNGDVVLCYVMKVALPAVLAYRRQVAAEHQFLRLCVCADVVCHLETI